MIGIVTVIGFIVFICVFCYGVVMSCTRMEGKSHGINGRDYQNQYSALFLPWAYDKGFTTGTRLRERYKSPEDAAKRNKIKYGREDSK